MSRCPCLALAVLALALPAAAGSGPSQESSQPLFRLPPTQELQPPAKQGPAEPVPGQAGKDVIWLPTPEPLVERMLMAQVGPQDVVYDPAPATGAP
jgi:hypothetical protein